MVQHFTFVSVSGKMCNPHGVVGCCHIVFCMRVFFLHDRT